MTPAQLRAGDKEALEAFAQEHGLDVPFDGMTPLGMMAFDGKIRLLKWMLKNGASVDYPGPNGWTPLMWAAVDGRKRAAEVLLAAGADATLVDPDGLTTLHLCCRCPRRWAPEIAQMLREAGADRFATNAEGLTAYQYGMARPKGTYATPALLRALT